MDYSSLILMERDNETGFVSKEVGSFQVSEGAEFVKNFYVKGDTVYFIFDTKEDVEEWQYSAIYDLFDYELFKGEGLDIEDIEDEYWDCVYLYSGNENYYYRIKFFDDFDSDITTFTELFSEQHIDDIFKAFDSFMNKEECKLFSKVSVDSDLLDKDFYSIIVRYNQNDYTYSLDMDTSSSEKNS